MDSREANVSFFSGDTSAAFAAASAAATISFQRGYRSAPYVTGAGAVFAAATGLLRSAADVHWPSDVLVGAALGTGLGLGLPLILHPRRGDLDGANAGAPVSPARWAEPAMLRFSGAF
jgi:membrane-associated phospholipid phosphatase